MFRILVINPGATSTKIAVYEDENEVFKKTINHPASDIGDFEHIPDQFDYRFNVVKSVLNEAGYSSSDFDAVAGRGGLLRHIPSGTYEVNDRMVHDIMFPPYGEHASNLGPLLAKAFAQEAGVKAYITDPVSTDELTEIAHISGFKGMVRESFFHALNEKGMARKASAIIGKPYEELDLIVVHMGGGVTVAAHHNGRVIDNFNAKDEGAFSMDRGGQLPVNALINYCFSGKTKAEVKKTFGYEAGVFSYLGTRDFREVEDRAFEQNEREARLIFDALAYQFCKDIGAMAAVLKFHVDAVVLTGGMANSKRFCDAIRGQIETLAPIIILPGEAEMESLALGALRVLRGQEPSEY